MTYLEKISNSHVSLIPLQENMAEFLLELVNTPLWLEFIGQRHVNTLDQAKAYIEKINNTPDFHYWAIQDQDNHLVGLISLIKRENLEYFDLGFALLPQHIGKRLAFWASKALIDHLQQYTNHLAVYAVTTPTNYKSLTLLNSLEFKVKGFTKIHHENLLLYQLNLR
ncbi:GNAT family N-acetyltransferase [Myroides sp. LJL119]